MKRINKVVIFAGGQGTRMAEFTDKIPKPLVPVGDEPIVLHIMRHFYRQGYNEFVLALGYKAEAFKEFFRDYRFYNKSVSFSPYGMKIDDTVTSESWTVHLVETGLNSTTGQRLDAVRNYLGDEPFFLTYGDGYSDVDLRAVEDRLFNSNHIATITAVPIQEKFGILGVDEQGNVNKFAEKSSSSDQYINGGFIACKNELLDYVNPDSGDFSFEALTQIADDKKLGYVYHPGFWKAMDSKKDVDSMNEIFNENPELFGFDKK